MKSYLFPFLLAAQSSAFAPQINIANRCVKPYASNVRLGAELDGANLFVEPELFEDDEDMIPVAEAYIRAKYKQVAAAHGHSVANKDDVREVLQAILPPVTLAELAKEKENIMKDLLSHEQNSPEAINEDDFVKSMIKNSYWRDAGDIVVKELMYFDCLHSYYTTGKPLLDDKNYDELHENLTWEGSSIATMNSKEVQFVSAVAASKRGEPLLDDAEYTALKTELKKAGSWVVNRGDDALEKLGLNTFIGYLHRALA